MEGAHTRKRTVVGFWEGRDLFKAWGGTLAE